MSELLSRSPAEWLAVRLASLGAVEVPADLDRAARRACLATLGRRVLGSLWAEPSEYARLRRTILRSVLTRRRGGRAGISEANRLAIADILRRDEGRDPPPEPPVDEDDAPWAGRTAPLEEEAARLAELVESALDLWGSLLVARPERALGWLLTGFQRRLVDRLGRAPSFRPGGADAPSGTPKIDADMPTGEHHAIARWLTALHEASGRARKDGTEMERSIHSAYVEVVTDLVALLDAWGDGAKCLPFVLRKLFPGHAWIVGVGSPLGAWTEVRASSAWSPYAQGWPAAWSFVREYRPELGEVDHWRSGYDALAGALDEDAFLSRDEAAVLSAAVRPPSAVDHAWRREVDSLARGATRINAEAEKIVKRRMEDLRRELAERSRIEDARLLWEVG